MRALLILILFTFSISTLAEKLQSTTIVQKLVYLKEQRQVNVSAINSKILEYNKMAKKTDQLQKVKEYLEYNGESYNLDYWQEQDYVENQLSEKLGWSLEVDAFVPSSENTCCKGHGSLVAEYLQNMADNPFTEQFVISASKYRNTEEGEVWDEEAENVWSSWDNSSLDVLVLYSISDSGEEQNVLVVSKCQ